MAGRETPISDELKKHFIDGGHWDIMPGELKYVYALIDMMRGQMEHEAGEHVTYRAALNKMEHVPEDMKEGLASILPEKPLT